MKDLTIVFAGQATLIGEYDDEPEILHKPRAILMSPDGRQMAMTPLIGEPEKVCIDNASLHYKTTNKELIALYVKSTTKLVLAN